MDKSQKQRTQEKTLIIPNLQLKGPLPNIGPAKKDAGREDLDMVLTFSISKLNTRETFKLSITNNDDFTTSMKIRWTTKYIYVYN